MANRIPLVPRLQHFLHDAFSRLGYGIERLSFPNKQAHLQLVRDIRAGRRMLVTPTEGWMIASLIQSVSNIPGEFAEVGTYQGATAGLIASTDTKRSVYVFDTFEGLPAPSGADGSGDWAYRGNFDAGFEEVKTYLSKWPNIRIYRGLFPESAKELGDLRFSFVHLDVDLYESTLASLEWFYPRMSPGAVLLTHDYDYCPGVPQAFREFLAQKPDILIELPTNQAFFIKK